MKRLAIAVSCCITLAAVLAYAQGDGFQTATVVSIEKLAANAQHMEEGDHYKISMRMADMIYVCKVSGQAATFMDWTSGKEFPAKEDGKVLHVKNKDGQIVDLNINSKKKPK